MSMPVITLTPSNSSNARRDASFSSYLGEKEENFVLTLSGRKKAEDKEIDVFDAHKYFNEGTNQICKIVKKDSPYVDQGKKYDPFEVLWVKTGRRTSTPSIRSESSCKSSCNSRSRLMHGVSRNQQPGKMNKRITFLDIISCSCIGKDSKDIHDYVVENWKSRSGEKTRDRGVKNSESKHNCVKSDEPGKRLNSDGHFSFPVFRPNPGNHEEDGTNKRKSLEVFGSPELDDRIYCRGLEKKFNMFAWNVVPPGCRVANQIKLPPISKGIDFDETRRESDRDASSETFEIESMPKNGGLSLSRQGSDSMSSRNVYAPSEASVDWSVITASAADFSSLSDSDDGKTGNKVKNSSSNVVTPKAGSNFLSGCKNQKAIRVAGNVHNPYTKAYSNAREFQK